MRLGILGPLLVLDDQGRETAVASARQRSLLAALLVRANRMVPVDELAEIVWDGAPPGGAARTVRSYVVRLRHQLGPQIAARIKTRDPGYVCELTEHELDTLRFEVLCREGGSALRSRDWDGADAALAEALGLWRGTALADVPSQALQREYAQPLEQTRLQALDWRIEADLHLGRHDQLVPELQALIEAHPLREHGHQQLMLALYRCGRTAEALEAYRRARSTLVAELGVEPGPPLRDLHQRILAADTALLAPPAAPAANPVRPAPAVPHQLPASVDHFTGRAEELRALSALAERAARNGGAAIVSAIGGAAGVGKTALAVHWAHQAADGFPDGQLYVNLRGYDERDAVSAEDALAGFLRTLGLDGRDVPTDAEERSACFRSLLAGRRVLIVLDNARTAQQVRPLLPGTAGCLALVTSRDRLAGLVARDGAVRVELDVLPADEATGLLHGLLGDRADTDPQTVAALAERCCRLPLALRIAAELAAARPALPLAALTAELADVRRRLDVLSADGDDATAVRAVFSWSYRSLEPDAARAFRLVSLHPGESLDARTAAALLGTDLGHARRVLDHLARAHLVQETGADRYSMHDLLRAYARELAAAEDEEPAQHAALTALLDYYLHTAAAAMGTLYPAEAHRRPDLPAWNGACAPVADTAAALAWLDAERDNLLAATALAADLGRAWHTAALSGTVERYFSLSYLLPEADALHRHALRAARRAGDRSAEATALTHLGLLTWIQNRFEAAADLQHRALALFRATADRPGQARALHRLALTERQLGLLDAAVDHAEQAGRLSRETGDALGEARALQSVGLTLLAQGRHQDAAAPLKESLTRCDALGDPIGRSVVAKALGVIALHDGDLASAQEHLGDALALCRASANANGEAEALSQLGLLHLAAGDLDRAETHQRQARDRFRELKDHSAVAEVLDRWARVDLRAGRRREAAAKLGQALELARRLHARCLECTVLNTLGEALHADARPDAARAAHAAALALAEQTGNREEQARARRGLAPPWLPAADHCETRPARYAPPPGSMSTETIGEV